MNQLAEKTEKLYFIDLFAGAGGLSEGFIQAGFYPIAHVEMNEFAAKTLVTRSAYYYLRQARTLSKYYDCTQALPFRRPMQDSTRRRRRTDNRLC